MTMKEKLVGWVRGDSGIVAVGDPVNVAKAEWDSEAFEDNEGVAGTSAVEIDGAFLIRTFGAGGSPVYATVDDEGVVVQLRVTVSERELDG
jgi:hypothetical protein